MNQTCSLEAKSVIVRIFTAESVVENTYFRVVHLKIKNEHETRNVKFLVFDFGGEVIAEAVGGEGKSKPHNYMLILLLLLVIHFYVVVYVTTCLRMFVAPVLGRG